MGWSSHVATVDGHKVAAPHFGWGALSSGPLCPLNSIPNLPGLCGQLNLKPGNCLPFINFFSFVIVSYAHTYRLLKAKLFKTFWAHSLYHTDEVIFKSLSFLLSLYNL